jgi:hypothetical protein
VTRFGIALPSGGRSSPALGVQSLAADGSDDPCDLRFPKDSARERLHRLRELGFDEIVLVPRGHDAEHLQALHELTANSR